jgi:hypothetical protein
MSSVMRLIALSRSPDSAIAYGDIEWVHVDPEMGLTVAIRPQRRIIYLGFGQLEEKYRRLKQLLPYLAGKPELRDFQLLDANNPDRVVVQLDSGKQPGGTDT